MAAVTLRGITKSYDGEVEVISGIDLEIADGELMVFVGPSGCGKSTTLRMIAGLEDITGGTLSIGEQVVNDLPAAKRGVAMVFQSYALYPHMTVAENMGFALKLAGRPRAEVTAAVERASEILQLEGLLHRKPKALSGGQRQRVAIGRAIVRDPDVFLFDEPLSNLDAALRVQTRNELAQLHQRLGTTMVYVTHDQVEAMTLGHRIAVFNRGKIEQCGTPQDLYERPSNLFVAGFMGSPVMNFLPVALQVGAQGTELKMPDGRTWPLPHPERYALPLVGGEVTLGFRPEQVELRPSGQGDVAGQVERIEYLGSERIVHIQLQSQGAACHAMVREAVTQTTEVGQKVDICLADAPLHLFDANGVSLLKK